MSYEELSLSGFVKEMKEVSSGAHTRKFCFVLGAGASISSGIKSGQELVDTWDKELQERNEKEHLKWKKKSGITDENKYGFYSQYYERRFRQPGDGYNYLEKLMESANPSIGYVMLSHILKNTNHNVVITTNFDHLAEDAVNYYEHSIPLVIGHESLSHYVTKQTNRPMIIKIHRDLLLDPKNRATEVDKLHDDWEKALDIIFSEYHPIFIGYAGNDNSLMDFLTNNHEKYMTTEWKLPYWMVYKTDKMSEKVLAYLDKSEGYLIRHNGFDEVMYLLGAVFDYKLPSKEDFFRDAEKRFQMLSDSIDAFTKKSVAKEETDQAKDEYTDETNDASEVSRAVQQITSKTELQRLYREAVLLHNNEKYKEAIQIYEQLIEKSPENARYQNDLGVSLHEMGRYEESLKVTQKAIDLDPGNAEYYDSLGVTLHEMKRYEDALRETQKAIDLEPGNARYHDSLGTTLYEMKRYEDALRETQKAIDLNPENAEYHSSLGQTLLELGRYEDALEALKRAIELDSENADYYIGLMAPLLAMKRYEEALKAGQKAVELEPDNKEYKLLLEQIRNRLNPPSP